MTNLVNITIKATNSTASGFAAVKAQAAKAGHDAGNAWSHAFKASANANVGKGGMPGGSGSSSSGILGNNSQGNSLISRLYQNANMPGGLGILGAGPQGSALISQLKAQIAKPGGISLFSGSGGAGSAGSSAPSSPSSAGSTSGSNSASALVKAINANTNSNTANTSSNMSTSRVLASLVSHLGSNKSSGSSSILSSILGKGGGSAAGLLAGKGAGAAAGGISGVLDSGGVAGGMLPGIPGISGMAATITGLAGALIAVLPAITSVLGGLSAIGGGFMILESTDKKFAASMSNTMGSITKVFKAAAMPLAKPLEQAASQVAGFFKQIGPQLKEVFSAAVPLIEPLVKGFEGLVSGALPGFLAMIKAAGPVFTTLAGAFSDLGKNLGEMFTDFSKDGGASATILKAFLDIINALLPFIGTLAKIMVSALAPAVKAFSGAITQVLPALTPLVKILGQLAGAVLTDLASILKPVAQMLVDLAPSFTTLAKVANNLFNTLENSGVFAILGDALESLAKPLAGLINAIVGKLAPILPPLINAFGKLAGTLTNGIVTIVGQLAGALTKMIQGINPSVLNQLVGAIVKLAQSVTSALVNAIIQMAGPLIKLIIALDSGEISAFTVIAEAFAKIAGVVTPVLSGAIAAIATALTAIIKAVPPSVMTALGMAIVGIAAATKIWAAANVIFSASNPFLAIATAALILVGLIIKYHKQIWDFIVKTWNAIFSFVTGIWNNIMSFAKQWWPLLLGVGGLIYKYHEQIWDFIQKIWNDIYKFFVQVWNNIMSFAKQWWPLLLGPEGLIVKYHNQIWDFIQKIWHDIYNFFVQIWNSIYNWVSGKISDLSSFMSRMWDTIKSDVSRAWDIVYDNITGPIERAYDWVTQKLSSLANWMSNKWDDIKSTATHDWDDLENIFKKPVDFLINTIYDKGILRIWNDTVGKLGGPKLSSVSGFAAGGKIPGYGGGDVLPALLERGETIVSKDHSKQLAGVFAAAGVPGYGGGGIIGDIWHGITGAADDIGSFVGSVISKAMDAGKLAAAIASDNPTAFGNALSGLLGNKGSDNAGGAFAQTMLTAPGKIIGGSVEAAWKDIIKAVKSGITGSGSDIVSYAESFIGKVPYVWGGTSPSGWDCSGFVQYVYDHFGYNPPRTSESQFDWVKHTPSPIAGGLAFFAGSDGTQSSPGHVGIIVNSNEMVDAYATGFGTRFNSILGSSGAISGYGIPPHGFSAGIGIGTTAGIMSASQISDLWISQGGYRPAAGNMARIANAESGDDPSRIQSGQAPQFTGWGLYQITPTSGINQGGIYGNLLNAANNTRAAISLFNGAGGYSPWASDPVGSSLTASGLSYDSGGWLPTGKSIAVNNTGRPERVVGPNDKMCLEISWAGGNSGADKGFVSWLKQYIRVNGGLSKVLGP